VILRLYKYLKYNMLVFIDESGDPGLAEKEGSSKFFTVSLVVFEENEDAIACDQRIELLKHELNWNNRNEFHFKNNSDKIREIFLKAVSPYNFFYYGIVMNKKHFYGDEFKDKKSFYKYSCSLVFENAKEKLDNATIVIDESGNLQFKNQLQKYLKNKINKNNKKLIKRIKMQRSEGNNLLQLADYIAGVINRSMLGKKKNSNFFRKLINHREIFVQIWPKTKIS